MPALFIDDWAPVASHRGWPRRLAPAEGWRALGEALRTADLVLLGLWGDRDAVHAAVFHAPQRRAAVLTLPLAGKHVPSLGVFHAPAIRLERALQDLHGVTVVALPDARPWLDHGTWQCAAPLGDDGPAPGAAGTTGFLDASGPALHQIPVGPVHAGIIEPGHFRFTAHGETVVRLEERLGYAHKGIERLMQGGDAVAGTRLAARVSGDSSVACSWAYCRAVELALGIEPPPRATVLRAVMAELERLANHLGDVGAICNDASFSLMHAECIILREHVLRVAGAWTGHRLMMDRVVPGGVAVDLDDKARDAVQALVRRIDARLPELVELYDNTASLQDRTVGTGRLPPTLAAQFGCGGCIGRASGRDFDARRDLAYPPYDRHVPLVTVFTEGDVDARVRVRLAEIDASLRLIESLLTALPAGPIACLPVAPPTAMVEGSALVEGFRGDILAYVRLAPGGAIERCHLRDPSWFQWPLLEAAIEGNIVADFPLCNKSFNCSYSGHDL
ncbi:MAG: hydrogenase expression protein HypE [Gammaproteobacteria bacterium]|nr:hydrogenase expression protein HypE [Gammaproteobacteria bacterium]